MQQGPREVVNSFRPIPLTIPEGMAPNEFFNSAENIKDLSQNNGLLTNPENLLLYRKALGHSNEFDTSIIYNTSQAILDPLGRPVRRTQVPDTVKRVWNRMNQIILNYMLEQYDPDQALVLAGEASLDATWPLTAPGVPSIRMLHNHFIVFPIEQLRTAALANPANPNLTDGGQHSLFQEHMHDVYQEFFDRALDFQLLTPLDTADSQVHLTGYPQGLPCWEIPDGANTLENMQFWKEYDAILMGFLDFYRTFFSQVSTRNANLPKDLYFPDHVDNILLFDNDFLKTAKKVRDRCIIDAKYANSIRWQPAFKQLIYRNEQGRLIVTISQNSIGNAITELLGVVVKRVQGVEAYERQEPALIERLLEVRRRLIEADLGTGIATNQWPA